MPTWDQKLRGKNPSRVVAPAETRYKVLSIAIRSENHTEVKKMLGLAHAKFMDTRGPCAAGAKIGVGAFLQHLLEEYLKS